MVSTAPSPFQQQPNFWEKQSLNHCIYGLAYRVKPALVTEFFDTPRSGVLCEVQSPTVGTEEQTENTALLMSPDCHLRDVGAQIILQRG